MLWLRRDRKEHVWEAWVFDFQKKCIHEMIIIIIIVDPLKKRATET